MGHLPIIERSWNLKLIQTLAVRHSSACGIANSIDPDQTAPKEQSDQSLHRLCGCFNPNTELHIFSRQINSVCPSNLEKPCGLMQTY